MASANSPSFSFDVFRRNFNSSFEQPIQKHLKLVYTWVAVSSLVSAAGAYFQLCTNYLAETGSLLSGLAAIFFLLAIITTHDSSGKGAETRIGLLLGYSLSTGLGLAPLLNNIIQINPAIISTAFLSAALIFICFSICAVMSPRGKYLFLGAPLLSLIWFIIILSLANIFIGSTLIFEAYLYIGFVVACGFVLYDTQIIIERRIQGDKDFVWHSVILFVDFIDIFRHLLRILASKEDNQNKKRKN